MPSSIRRILLFTALLAVPAHAGLLYDDLELEYDILVQGGGVLVDSVGLAVRAGGPTSGIVTVNDLPERAAITMAFLYWQTIGGAGDGEMIFEGQNVTGLEVGWCEDTCWSMGNNHVYRADVSAIVTAPGDYDVSGVGDGTGSGVDGQGVTILAFYSDPSADNAGFVKVYEGARDNMPGPGAVEATYETFDGLYVPVMPTRAQMTWSVGDSQPFPDGNTTFEGNVLATDNFDGDEGPLWDTDEWDVLPYMYVGMTEAVAGLSVDGSPNDCLAIGFAILEYDLPCTWDGDGDGTGICQDCDDADPTLNGDDLDLDGRSVCTGDCDDSNAEVYSGHPEICDGFDNDCDGVIPSGEGADNDGDGFDDCTDCNDEADFIHPGAPEIPNNGLDEDCDGEIDEIDGDDDDGTGPADDDSNPGDDDSAAGDDDGDDDNGGGGGRGDCTCDLGPPSVRPLASFLGVLLGVGLITRRRRSA